jgi:hypothetical protein
MHDRRPLLVDRPEDVAYLRASSPGSMLTLVAKRSKTAGRGYFQRLIDEPVGH